MLIDNMLAYSEVDEILNLLEEEYRNKIPEKVRSFFKEERMQEYKPEINVEIPLTEQNLKRETMVLLAILNLNYWCKSEEEKAEFKKELTENEEEKKRLEEKYNLENLFKKKRDIDEIKNMQIIEYKEKKWLQKVIAKIFKMLKRK